MAGPDSTVEAIFNLAADVSGAEAAESAVDSFNRSMRDLSSSSVALQSTQRDLNRQLRKTAANASAASGSFGAYQSSVLAAAAANESFENNTHDLRGALDDLDHAMSKNEALDQLSAEILDTADDAGSLTEALGEISESDAVDLDDRIEPPDEAAEALDNLTQTELSQLLEQISGETETATFLEGVDADRIAHIEQAEEALSSLSEAFDDNEELQFVWDNLFSNEEALADAIDVLPEQIEDSILADEEEISLADVMTLSTEDMQSVFDEQNIDADATAIRENLNQVLLDQFDADEGDIESLIGSDRSAWENFVGRSSSGQLDRFNAAEAGIGRASSSLEFDPESDASPIPPNVLTELQGVESVSEIDNIEQALLNVLSTPDEQINEILGDATDRERGYDAARLKKRIIPALSPGEGGTMPDTGDFMATMAEQPALADIFAEMDDEVINADIFERFREKYVDVPLRALPSQLKDPETGEVTEELAVLGNRITDGLDEALLDKLERADIETVGDLLPEEDITQYIRFFERLEERRREQTSAYVQDLIEGDEIDRFMELHPDEQDDDTITGGFSALHGAGVMNAYDRSDVMREVLGEESLDLAKELQNREAPIPGREDLADLFVMQRADEEKLSELGEEELASSLGLDLSEFRQWQTLVDNIGFSEIQKKSSLIEGNLAGFGRSRLELYEDIDDLIESQPAADAAAKLGDEEDPVKSDLVDTFTRFRETYADIKLRKLPSEIRDPETGQIEERFSVLAGNAIGQLDEQLLARLEEADIETVGDLLPEEEIESYVEFFELLESQDRESAIRSVRGEKSADLASDLEGTEIPSEQHDELRSMIRAKESVTETLERVGDEEIAEALDIDPDALLLWQQLVDDIGFGEAHEKAVALDQEITKFGRSRLDVYEKFYDSLQSQPAAEAIEQLKDAQTRDEADSILQSHFGDRFDTDSIVSLRNALDGVELDEIDEVLESSDIGELPRQLRFLNSDILDVLSEDYGYETIDDIIDPDDIAQLYADFQAAADDLGTDININLDDLTKKLTNLRLALRGDSAKASDFIPFDDGDLARMTELMQFDDLDILDFTKLDWMDDTLVAALTKEFDGLSNIFDIDDIREFSDGLNNAFEAVGREVDVELEEATEKYLQLAAIVDEDVDASDLIPDGAEDVAPDDLYDDSLTEEQITQLQAEAAEAVREVHKNVFGDTSIAEAAEVSDIESVFQSRFGEDFDIGSVKSLRRALDGIELSEINKALESSDVGELPGELKFLQGEIIEILAEDYGYETIDDIIDPDDIANVAADFQSAIDDSDTDLDLNADHIIQRITDLRLAMRSDIPSPEDIIPFDTTEFQHLMDAMQFDEFDPISFTDLDWVDTDVLVGIEEAFGGVDELFDVSNIEEFTDGLNEAFETAGKEADIGFQEATQKYLELASVVGQNVDKSDLIPDDAGDLTPDDIYEKIVPPGQAKRLQAETAEAVGEMHRRVFGDADVQKALFDLIQVDQAIPEIQDVIERSDSPAEAMRRLQTKFENNKKLLSLKEWADENNEALSQTIDQFVDEDTIDVGEESLQDLQQKLRGSILSDDDEDEIVALQEEILSSIVANLDSKFLQDLDTPDDLPITDSLMRFSLLQEMLDAETGTPRFQAAQGLLEHLEKGNLGLSQTMFHTDQGKEVFQQELAQRLPEQYLGDDNNVAEAVTESFESTGRPLSDFIGPESDSSVMGPVSDAMSSITGIDDEHQAERVAQIVDSVISDQQFLFGQQAGAEGLLMASQFDRDNNLVDLMPGTMDGVDNAEDYISEVKDILDSLEQTQDRAKLIAGVDTAALADAPVIGHLFSNQDPNRRRRRGLSGYLLRRLTQATSGVASFGTEAGHTGKSTKKLVGSLSSARSAYQSLVPILRANSLNLGAMNIAFESMGIMIFKLTTLLGPLVSLLAGVASGLTTAAAGAASFVGAGAISYFEDMEETMAGVNSKQEAMGEFMEHVRDMALQAIEPLRAARLADGRSGGQLFEDITRGGLRLLNRFARAMASLAEMPVVSETIAELGNIIHRGDGDNSFLMSLKTALRNILPTFVDFVDAFVSGAGAFIEKTSEIAQILGDELLATLQNSSTALTLLTYYGAGFIHFTLMAVRAITKLIDQMVQWLQIIPLVDGSTTQLMFTLGGLIGAISMVNRVSLFLSSNWKALKAAGRTLTKVNDMMTLSYTRLATAQSRVAVTAAYMGASLMVALGGVYLIAEAINNFDDSPIYAMITGFVGLASAIWGVTKAMAAYNTYAGFMAARTAATNANTLAAVAAQRGYTAATIQATAATKANTLSQVASRKAKLASAVASRILAHSNKILALTSLAAAGSFVGATALGGQVAYQKFGKGEDAKAAETATQGMGLLGASAGFTVLTGALNTLFNNEKARSVIVDGVSNLVGRFRGAGRTISSFGSTVSKYTASALSRLIDATIRATVALAKFAIALTRAIGRVIIGSIVAVSSALMALGAVLVPIVIVFAKLLAGIAVVVAVFAALAGIAYAVYKGLAYLVNGIMDLLSLIPGVGSGGDNDNDEGSNDGGSSNSGGNRSGPRSGPDRPKTFNEMGKGEIQGKMKSENPFNVSVLNFGRSAKRAMVGTGSGRDQTGNKNPNQGVEVQIINNGYIGNRDFKRMMRDEIKDEFKKMLREDS